LPFELERREEPPFTPPADLRRVGAPVHARVRFRAALPARSRTALRGLDKVAAPPDLAILVRLRLALGRASRPVRGIDAAPAPSYDRRHEAAPDPRPQAHNGRATSPRKPEGRRTRAGCPRDDLASCQEHVRELLRLQRRSVTPFRQEFRLGGSGSRCRPGQEPATCSRGLRLRRWKQLTARTTQIAVVGSLGLRRADLPEDRRSYWLPARETPRGRRWRQPGEAVPWSGRTS
jgi:hypothetical protein